MDTVDTLRMEPLDLKRFVLQADHPYLLQQLRQLKVVKQDAQISLSTGWPKLHEQLFKNQGLTWKDLQPPPELESNAWYLSLCRAKKEILNYHLVRGKGNERGMWTTIDLSQSITRSPRGCGSYLRLIAWSHGPVFGASECVFPERSVQGVFGLKLCFPLLGCARAFARLRVGVLLRFGGLCQTLTPKMRTWISNIPTDNDHEVTPPETAHGRIMLGVEAMALQGFPASWIPGCGALPEKVSNTLLLDLAGNAFSSSVFGAVYLSMLAEVPPIAELPADTATAGDLLSIMNLMG